LTENTVSSPRAPSWAWLEMCMRTGSSVPLLDVIQLGVAFLQAGDQAAAQSC